MRLFTYKALKNSTLNKIYERYADKKISLLRFRSRVYENKMTMEEALTKPLSGNCLGLSKANVYINKLYSKLCIENPIHVTRPHFVVKMSNGFAPEVAIINKYPGRVKKESPAPIFIKDVLKELKRQEVKEIKEAVKKKVRPFNRKEKAYIENVDLLNNAFSKVKNKGVHV